MIISQNTYPKEIVLKGDSLIAFTYNQVRIINSDLEAFQGCKIELDSTEKLALKYELQLKDGTNLVNNLKAQIAGYDKIVAWQDEKFKIKEEQYQKSIKANKTNKTIFGVVIGTLLGTSGALLIWGLTK